MKEYDVTLHIITPLIIHSGEIFESLELMPLQEKKLIFIVNVEKAFGAMSEQERESFFQEMDKLSGNAENDKRILQSVRATVQSLVLKHPELIQHKAPASDAILKDLINNPHAVVAKIFTDAVTTRPYIPGSSVKGSLRTALLEKLRAEKKIVKANELVRGEARKFQPTDFEMQIMKNSSDAKFDIESDPFRFVKVSDFHCESVEVRFDTVRVIGKEKKQKGIPIYTQMIASEFTDKKSFTAKGKIAIDEKALAAFCENNRIVPFISIDAILESANYFSKLLLENTKHPVLSTVKELIKTKIDATKGAPLRLGRFTQIESKTFKIERKERGAFRINFEGGVSRSLVGGSIPAGWCVMEIKK